MCPSADVKPRTVFMGTPDFAVPVLSALVDASYDIVGVYTRRDRRVGRGRHTVPLEMKRFALEHGLDVFQPASLRRDESARRELALLAPDIIVVAAYGLFLPSDALSLPRLGCLNIHPSLLPRHRGASPVASAILGGDDVTGVTIIQLDEGMDSGPIIARQETAIGPDETAEDLTARLFRIGAALLLEVLPGWELGEIQARPQDHSRTTVTGRLSKEDGEIDWDRSAVYIARQVRAFHPWPGTFTRWRGKTLKIIAAAVGTGSKPDLAVPSGQVVSLPEGGVGVGTSDGILTVKKLQLEGRRAVEIRDFLQGYRDFVGSKVGTQ